MSSATTSLRARRPFANEAVHLRSWYPAVPSRRVRSGRVRSHAFLGRRVAVYRTEEGEARVLAARCPHLGANLGDGAVEGDRLVCPFHHWEFGPDGRCVGRPSGAPPASGARTFSYPTTERFGMIWAFNGPEPTFALPPEPDGDRLLRLPEWTLACHHHLVASNALDLNHWRCVHGMVPLAEPQPELLENGGFRVRLELGAREDRLLFRLARADRLEAVYTVHGGNLAVIDVERPWRFRAVLAHRPSGEGGTRTRLFALFPTDGDVGSWPGLGAAASVAKLAALGLLLADDRAILEGIEFWPRLTAEDALLARFVQHVNGLEPFEPSRYGEGGGGTA